MDVIGSDPPMRRPWAAERAVRLVGAAAVLTALAGAAVAGQARLQTAPPPVTAPPVQVRVVFGGAGSAPTGDRGQGDLQLLLINRSAVPATVSGLTLAVQGVRVLSVQPALQPPLQPYEQRAYVLRYAVPDCALLRLPGTLQLSVAGPDGTARRQSLPLADPSATGAAALFLTCTGRPVAPPDLAVRPLGGSTSRSGDGARGSVRLEVRNGGPTLRLLAVTAEVPGVRFRTLVPSNGAVLAQDERIELALGFEIDDCARLRRTGRLVLRTARGEVERELGLTITNDREAGTLRQVALDRVLSACPR